jgi:UPF0755 protein
MALSGGSKGFLAVLLFVAALAIGTTVGLTGGGGGSSADEAGGAVIVEIPEGVGAAAVGDLLAERGVIRSATTFKLMARFDDRASQIQSGTYELTRGLSTDEVLEILAAGPPRPPTFRVTIPEGLTVAQTLERIAGAEGSPYTVDQLRAALDTLALPDWVPVEALPAGAEVWEGLLFPNTYDFRADGEPADVLGRLVAETERILEAVTPPADLDRYQVLVMASLIEREARLREEQRTISAVMHNRLADGMRLQIDATVLYALGEHRDRVLHADLEVDSPWNTYRYAGLPPTPISGAGAAAIEAAANPTDEDYLYYVADPETGAHVFTRTYDEHLRAIRQVRG